MLAFNLVPPEGSPVTGMQCWFPALSLMRRHFSTFSESFHDIMDFRWWIPGIIEIVLWETLFFNCWTVEKQVFHKMVNPTPSIVNDLSKMLWSYIIFLEHYTTFTVLCCPKMIPEFRIVFINIINWNIKYLVFVLYLVEYRSKSVGTVWGMGDCTCHNSK